jgi:hypothetical protein
MSGVPGLMCPECGRTAKSEKKLGKSRRRWGWAIIGLLLLIPGGVGVAYPSLAAQDWLERIPSWVLVRYADPISSPPYMPSSSKKLTRTELMTVELCRRYQRGELSLSVRRRCVEEQFGVGSRDPVTIQTRDRWPAGVQVLVSTSGEFSGPLPRTMTATPQFQGGRELTAYDKGWSSYPWGEESSPWLQPIGTPPAGTTQLQWAVSLAEGGHQVWSGHLVTQLTIGGTVDEVIQPVVIPAAAEAIQRSMAQTAKLEATDTVEWLDFQPVQMTELEGTTVGLVVEFRYDGKPVATARTIWVQAADAKARQGSSGWYRPPGTNFQAVPIDGDTALLSTMKPGDTRWMIHVRGDGEMALRDFKATRYWSGEFDMKPYPMTTIPSPQP